MATKVYKDRAVLVDPLLDQGWVMFSSDVVMNLHWEAFC